MRWTAHIEGGPMRVNHAAVSIGDKIYSFGGYCSTEEYKDWDRIPVYVLDTTTFRWATVKYKDGAHIPFQRYGHTAVAYGDKVYMWGGRNNAIACDILYCFDTKTLTWSTPKVTGMLPYAKDGHTACIIENKMYIFGGFEYNTEQYSQETNCLNLDTMHWSFVNIEGWAPSHRDFHTAVPVGKRMYIFGGRGDLNAPHNSQEEAYCPQVFYLDTNECKWYTGNPTGTWPNGRRSHSAWLYNGDIYIFGGFNGETRTHFNDLFRYSVKQNHWEYIAVNGLVPCKRRRQACIVYKNKVYLFGGTSPCPHVKNHPIEEGQERTPERLIDNSDLHVLDYSPNLKTLAILVVLQHKLDYSTLPREIIILWKTKNKKKHKLSPLSTHTNKHRKLFSFVLNNNNNKN